MATPATPLTGRALEIFNEVHTHNNGIWEAFDQGRMTYAKGGKLEDNPWMHNATHANHHDWVRGWYAEHRRVVGSHNTD